MLKRLLAKRLLIIFICTLLIAGVIGLFTWQGNRDLSPDDALEESLVD